MAEFKGTIRLEDGEGLETSLMVDEGRLLMTAGEHEIGNWAIADLSAKRRNGEIRLQVEGDELVVGAADVIGLATALGITNGASNAVRAKKPKARKRLKRKERSQPERAPQAAPVVPEAPIAPVVVAPEVVAPEVVAPEVAVPDPVPVVDRPVESEPSWWARLSLRTKLIGGGVVGLVVLGVIAPTLLAVLLMIAGMGTLFLAIAAKDEGGTGFHPPPFFATDLAIGSGIGLVILAIVIMVIT